MFVAKINRKIYECINDRLATEDVIITDEQLDHIARHHPEAYDHVLIELQNTIISPDYILKDKKHRDTGLVIKELSSEKDKHLFVVLRVCTNTQGGRFSNSIISGWKINNKRLARYLRNDALLYKK